jgi:hypothetical protein
MIDYLEEFLTKELSFTSRVYEEQKRESLILRIPRSCIPDAYFHDAPVTAIVIDLRRVSTSAKRTPYARETLPQTMHYCFFCQFATTSKSSMSAHSNRHRNPYVCHCGESFFTLTDFNKHKH